MEAKYAINAKRLTKSFGKLKVLNGIDLQVERGSILALLGPNGAGKTTTVRILTTLLKADGGRAAIEGYDIVKEADKVRSVIGLTGQTTAVDEYLTGRQNLRMIGRLYHLKRSDVKRRTEQLLEQFDLVQAANRISKTYSGGMQRRLDLASSLIATPPVLFLDEPTTGLDPRSRLAMWDIIKQLVANGSTILLTTQHLDEADQLADQVVVIDQGKVIAEGTPDELKKRVGSERIELTFGTGADFAKAKQSIGKSAVETKERDRSMSIPNDRGVKKLRDILEQLEQQKIKVESLSLHKPTLDDVFLKLTGHKATTVAKDSEKKDAKGKK
jgi:ABC-2 type transport system ATP-binding protein